jgi:16S rRNA (uracil1498-N3)-methyltransferase
MDWLVEKAAELGVEEIVPVASERSVVRRDARGAAAHLARWERLALSAMKQSRRARRPSVSAPASLSAYLDQRDKAERLIAPWEGASGRTLGAHLAERPIAAGSRVALLIGPEGGLTQGESAAIAASGGEIVGLGRAILRSETAALVGLAILMSAGGEL